VSIELSAPEVEKLKPRLALLGIGGGGGNALRTMIDCGLKGVDLYAVNTDAQALEEHDQTTRIQIGANITKGLGAGADPKIGKKAAQESIEELKSYLKGINMLFITACMGGGTGTGAAPVIANLAKEMGILTVGVVTTPWKYDGSKRMKMAKEGIEELSKCLDTMIVVPNENVFRVANIETSFDECNEIINRTLYDGVSAISSLITKRGRINIDFADVKTIMAFVGKAMFGVGQASGDDRAVIAAKTSISNPMLDGINLRDSKGLLISITANTEITPVEIDAATNVIQNEVNNPDECEIITGVFMDEELGDELIVATVATGMSDQTDDGIVEMETPVLDNSQSSSNDIQTVELEVRKVDQDYPVNAEEYPDLIDEDLDYQGENSVEVDDQNDQKASEDLPDPEDWENDDVPLFKSDRLDNNDDGNPYDSQMEIPAFLRKK
tara:strand:+ start:223 stop:1542 length:1320 start_codon:yes stop_codon:yes gene_type:complete